MTIKAMSPPLFGGGGILFFALLHDCDRDMDLTAYLIICPLLFLAGFVDAIAGGGGLISLPAYVMAGLPIHQALAANKLSSPLGTIVSTTRYWKNKFLDIPFTLPSVATALVGSYFGARLVMMTDAAVINALLVPVLAVSAFFVLRNKKPDPALTNSMPRKKALLIATIATFFIGCYDGFYGPGTGTFLILMYTFACRLDARLAAGNTKLVNLASNIGGFFTFVWGGTMNWHAGLVGAVFCILGHYIGAGLAIKQGYRIVRPVILVVLGLLLLRIVTQ